MPYSAKEFVFANNKYGWKRRNCLSGNSFRAKKLPTPGGEARGRDRSCAFHSSEGCSRIGEKGQCELRYRQTLQTSM
jgi:hypothetical protein